MNYNQSFFLCRYEESISEYSIQVNQFNIKDNLLTLQGQPISSNVTHKKVTPTLVGRTISLSKQYGTEVGVGGNVDWKKGSISVTSGSQEYDLKALSIWCQKVVIYIEIKRVYYEGTHKDVKIL